MRAFSKRENFLCSLKRGRLNEMNWRFSRLKWATLERRKTTYLRKATNNNASCHCCRDFWSIKPACEVKILSLVFFSLRDRKWLHCANTAKRNRLCCTTERQRSSVFNHYFPIEMCLRTLLVLFRRINRFSPQLGSTVDFWSLSDLIRAETVNGRCQNRTTKRRLFISCRFSSSSYLPLSTT